MLALAAVVIAAAFWRPVRHGAVLLAGAVIPMAAQAISAARPGRRRRVADAVRDLAGSGLGDRAHDQFWPHAGVLDLLRLPRRAGRLVHG